MKHHAGVIIEIHFLPDGQEWHAVDFPPMIGRKGGWRVGPFVVWGNRVIVFGDQLNWVGTLDLGD